MKPIKLLGFGVCGPGEADKYLENTLKEFKRLCDETTIVMNNATPKEYALVKSYGFTIIEDNREWGKEQWRIKEDAVKTLEGDWCIVLDMDEILDPLFTKEKALGLANKGGAGYYFYVVNLYKDGYVPEWCFFNVRMFNLNMDRSWERKPLHPGLAPKLAYHRGNYAPFYMEHYGLKDKNLREVKAERYKKYDPNAVYESKAYYNFLEQDLKATPYDRSKVHNEVENEVKDYHHKELKEIMSEKKKFVYIRRTIDGALLDIPAEALDETLSRGGFEVVSKDVVVVKDSVETTTTDTPKPEVDANAFQCDECPFIAKSKLGFSSHKRKHARDNNSEVQK